MQNQQAAWFPVHRYLIENKRGTGIEIYDEIMIK